MSSWKCSTCSKSFLRKGDLTRHKLLHTGYKPHVCLDCGKSFSQFSGLKTHKNVHTKVKPFKCGINNCSSAFGDPSSCTRHRKETHCRLGAYQCPQRGCTSSIKRRSAFTTHLKKHGIDPSTVDIDAAAPPTFSSDMPHIPRMDTSSQAPSLGLFDNSYQPTYIPFPNYEAQSALFSYDSVTPFTRNTIESYEDTPYIPATYHNSMPVHGSYPNSHEQLFTVNPRSPSQSPSSLISSLSPSPSLSLDNDNYQSSSSSGGSRSQSSCAELSPLSEVSSFLLSAEPSHAAGYGQTSRELEFEGSHYNSVVEAQRRST